MTASRPPGRMSEEAAVKMVSSSAISPFTSMRNAWNTRARRFVISFGGPGATFSSTAFTWP
eukprot:5535284-Pleurochrysis_carterae.AAC.1